MNKEKGLIAERINILDISTEQLSGSYEGIVHTKSLPCLSVVQATLGSYDIALDGGNAVNTGEMGVFVAPSGAMQTITHHDGSGGIMQAHWAFINATADGGQEMDLVFRFPLILPAAYNAQVFSLLNDIAHRDSCCLRYAAAYQLLDILLRCGERITDRAPVKHAIRSFVQENYTRRIRAGDIAEAIHCSPAQVFRYTKRYFGLSPANYINLVRLQNAALALECGDGAIKEIAFDCGFDDMQYFSRLFRQNFGRSPKQYRLVTRG